MRVRASASLVIAVWLASACAGAGDHQASAQLRACAGQQSMPLTTITDLAARLDALPQPVTVPCFVASLPRPLALAATTNVVSAQPAADALDPRIFILTPAMVLTVVPSGDGAHVVEAGQWTTPTRTLKGELPFPATAPSDPATPFTRVRSQRGTDCGLCHRNEQPSALVDGGFDSDAYRPLDSTVVSFEALGRLHDACVAQTARCELLHALFDLGTTTAGAFPAGVDTITH